MGGTVSEKELKKEDLSGNKVVYVYVYCRGRGRGKRVCSLVSRKRWVGQVGGQWLQLSLFGGKQFTPYTHLYSIPFPLTLYIRLSYAQST